MEKEEMGVDSHNYHTNTHRAPPAGSRVTNNRAFNLHNLLGFGKKLLKVFNFFVPTIVFILVLELLFRLLHLPPYPFSRNQYLYVKNEHYDFSLNKGHSGVMSNLEYQHNVYIDTLGFRDFHTTDVKIDSHKKRILLLGDSMTFGQGVEYGDSFAGLLSRNTNYQVFNAGVPSYGTIHSLGLVKDRGNQISPSIVIYFLYPGNDFYDNAMGFAKRIEKGYLTDNPKFKPPVSNTDVEVDYSAYSEKFYLGPLDKILLKKSYIYKYFRYKALYISSVRKLYEKKGITQLKSCALPYSTSPFMNGYTQEQEYKNTMSLILEMKKFVEKNLKARFILVQLPIREQVNPALLEYEEKLRCIKTQNFDLNNPHKYLSEFAKRNKITFIDPTDSLKQSFNKGKNPFFAIDTHFNKQGHKVVYELLLSKIQGVLNK